MTETDLLRRTKEFSLRVLRLAGVLPRTEIGRIIIAQLVRSATSVGSNYRAACRARSKRDFINKLGTVEEEADESAFWMEMVMEGGLLPCSPVEALHHEAQQLTRIMVASRISASRALRDEAEQRELIQKSKIKNQK
jgi:four helix bundle protein